MPKSVIFWNPAMFDQRFLQWHLVCRVLPCRFRLATCFRFILHAKKTAFIVEHDFIMATCQRVATDFWFPGSRADISKQDQIHPHVIDALAAPWFVLNLFRWVYFFRVTFIVNPVDGIVGSSEGMDDEVMRHAVPREPWTPRWLQLGFLFWQFSSRSFFVNHRTWLMLYLRTDVVCLKETKSLQVSTKETPFWWTNPAPGDANMWF